MDDPLLDAKLAFREAEFNSENFDDVPRIARSIEEVEAEDEWYEENKDFLSAQDDLDWDDDGYDDDEEDDWDEDEDEDD
jgi:hypothetical protein